jgi:hypothetical protein
MAGRLVNFSQRRSHREQHIRACITIRHRENIQTVHNASMYLKPFLSGLK